MLCSTIVYPYWFWLPAGQSTYAAESAGATVAGSVLGGVVAGGAAALLVVGILCGSWKLKHSNGKSRKVNLEEDRWADMHCCQIYFIMKSVGIRETVVWQYWKFCFVHTSINKCSPPLSVGRTPMTLLSWQSLLQWVTILPWRLILPMECALASSDISSIKCACVAC